MPKKIMLSDLTSDPIWRPFWPIFCFLRNKQLILVKFDIQRLSCVANQRAKSHLTTDPKWPPFLPNYWLLRCNGQNFVNFGLQMFWRLLINMEKSDFISNSTWSPYWPNIIFWEIMAGFSWNLISGGYHLWQLL